MKGLPETGQDVYLVAPSGATIVARVTDHDEQSTLLEFDGRASDPVSVLAGGHVAMQYTNLRGVCRVDGHAHKEPEPGLLRVDHTSGVQLIQRREYVRVDALVRATYEPYGADGALVVTTTVNVSGGGFMLAGSEGLRLHDFTDFTLELDGDTRDAGQLICTGRVVRETNSGIGIEIERVDERERERLIRWVFARQRLSRQIVGRP
jgi:hypothetical protein